MGKILLMTQQAASVDLRKHEYSQAFEHVSEGKYKYIDSVS